MFPEEASLEVFRPIIGSWYDSLEHPKQSQSQLLLELIEGYKKTKYGKDHHASEVVDESDFRANFPVVGYKVLNPYFARVQKGDHTVILPEPVVCWVMTRGSTGHAKVLPATGSHLDQIFTCGARAVINHVIRREDFGLLTGKMLNLSFPSRVHTTVMNGKTMHYGYSSGTYAKLNPVLGKVGLLPRQEDIDALGPGITKRDWERRFELVHQSAVNENVTGVIGVTPVILSFAKYVKRKHGERLRELWNLRALFCTSVRKIQFKYASVLRKHFGQVPVVEIYSATEGVFAQQLDDLPYVTPNYDQYFFEVQTGQGTKMLHELERGEWGKLIVSSCMFPRYDIGDLIESAGKNYFRVIGRNNLRTLVEHRLYRILFRWFL